MATAVHEPVLWGDRDPELAAVPVEQGPPEPSSWPIRAFATSLLVLQAGWLGLLYAAVQLLL